MLFKPVDLSASRAASNEHDQRLATIDRGLTAMRELAAGVQQGGVTPGTGTVSAEEVARTLVVEGGEAQAAALRDTWTAVERARADVKAADDLVATRMVELHRAEQAQDAALKRALKITFRIFAVVAVILLLRQCGR